VADDLGINCDDMATNSGLKYQSVIIVLHLLKVGIEKFDKPGVDNTGTEVKIPPMISLDSVMNTIQRCHYNVRADHISLGNDWAIHDLDFNGFPVFLSPLANSMLWTTRKHGAARIWKKAEPSDD
jgi:hypothetical protein